MNLRRGIPYLVALALAACAAAPVKQVPLDEQVHYWTLDHDSIPQDIPAEDGCLRVQVTIGADGKLADPKVLAVVGEKISAWLPGFLKQLRFDPAPENAGRTPIRTMLTWTLHYSVTTTTVASTSMAAKQAAEAQGPPPDSQAWNQKCQAEMDKQMGIDKTQP
jgi:hypothetical protein